MNNDDAIRNAAAYIWYSYPSACECVRPRRERELEKALEVAQTVSSILKGERQFVGPDSQEFSCDTQQLNAKDFGCADLSLENRVVYIESDGVC